MRKIGTNQGFLLWRIERHALESHHGRHVISGAWATLWVWKIAPKAWQSIHRFEGRSSFYTWLYSITVKLTIPAVQHGNVIEVKIGLVGVDEACSGVRSLQATLMVSVFFGELYCASWLRRIVLVLCGAPIAFLVIDRYLAQIAEVLRVRVS